jgi:DNA-binding transcriptional regulator GbsR (MarR family)
MEQEKFCSRCRKTKPASFFQTTKGVSRNTCTQCREQSSQSIAKKRETGSSQLFNQSEELEKDELRQRIKEVVSQNNSDEFFENNNQGVKINCTLKFEDFDNFENAKNLANNIAKYVQECDGYSYK